MLNAFISQKVVGAIVRHALTVAGGWLLAEGYTDEASWATITGGAVAFSGLAMSVFEKNFRF
jgi:hypothetical protein